MFPKDSVIRSMQKKNGVGVRIAYSIGHNKENTVNRACFPILTNHNLAISDAVLIGYDKSRKAKQC